MRVLYAHALVSAPRLALRPLAGIGPLLGDPRLAVTGVFLSLSRIVPDGKGFRKGFSSRSLEPL